jgi:hypothetical protein
MVVFYEGQSPVDPSTFLSHFNHAFALVQPQVVEGATRYRYRQLMKEGIFLCFSLLYSIVSPLLAGQA